MGRKQAASKLLVWKWLRWGRTQSASQCGAASGKWRVDKCLQALLAVPPPVLYVQGRRNRCVTCILSYKCHICWLPPFQLIIHSPFYHSTLYTLSNWQRLSINGVSICTCNCRSFSFELLYAVSSPPSMLHAQSLSASVDLTTRTPDAAECCRADRRRVLRVAKCTGEHVTVVARCVRFLIYCPFHLTRLPVYVQAGQTASCLDSTAVIACYTGCVCMWLLRCADTPALRHTRLFQSRVQEM